MTSIRLGFGCTLLERALNGRHLDGIGIYSKNLYAALRCSAGLTVLPSSFPSKPWEAPCVESFPEASTFGRAYGLSAAVSAVTSMPFSRAARIARRIDVFHAPDHLIPKIEQVPVVATICDALAVKRPDWINAGIGGFRPLLMKASAKWANHVIAISAAMVPDLVEYFGIPEKSITVVHLGISPQWLEPVPEAEKVSVLDKYGLNPGYFLFVGTLQPRKNVEIILEAYKELPDELRADRKLVIAGMPGWSSTDLVEKLRILQTERQCLWLDYIPSQDLRSLYQSAGAFVFPSLWEGFGMPVLEAFASGIPVMTSNLSSLPEVAGNAALLIDPYSVSELRAAMMKVMEGGDFVAQLVERGRARAWAMSWDLCASRTIDVYRKVLS